MPDAATTHGDGALGGVEPECVCGEINTRHCPVHGQGEVESAATGRVNVLPWLIAECLHKSRKSLDKIGEGDWTPQDSTHLALVKAVEAFFASEPQYRTGRIIHGDADA